jgi:hypothetical protein
MLSRTTGNHLQTYTLQDIATQARNLTFLDLITWIVNKVWMSIFLNCDHDVEGLQARGSWIRILLVENDLCQRGCNLGVCRPVLEPDLHFVDPSSKKNFQMPELKCRVLL